MFEVQFTNLTLIMQYAVLETCWVCSGMLAVLMMCCCFQHNKDELSGTKYHNSEITKVVVVDKDFAEVNAIKAVLPDAQIQLCVFHVLKAI